ncbi:hypothetical protein NA57DRAFT_28594, partial [Rhizodiscina lignyota]
AKRRRVRKGTHSCWECKRRKVRCMFASATDAVCITCQRRSTKCISQELPEEPSQVEDSAGRIIRVEALLSQLVEKADHSAARDGAQSTSDEGRRPRPAAPTPVDSEHTPFMSLNELSPVGTTTQTSTPTPARTSTSDAGKYEKVSQALLAAYPSREDIAIILRMGNGTTTFCHQVNVKSRSQLRREGFDEEAKLAEMPSPHTHPVLLAKRMLMFASHLLRISPHEHVHGLSEPHRVIMERLADTAINLVTKSEELLGTMESLECVLLEGFYHLDCGNIRRAWLAFRRAMGAAQLMGIHRPCSPPVAVIESSTNIDPQFMWFQIVYMDRFLSVMLGLPQGDYDVILGSDDTTTASDEPSDRLERLHAVISARILERNQLGKSQRAIDLTRDIDKELLEVAESLPPKYWEPPNFAGLEKDSPEAYWESMRIKDQIFHYTLLNQLHLPFLLCPGGEHKTEYSRVTGVNASREILTRFVAFRTFNPVTACCRLADFLALVAGMTLILAHLDSHRRHKGMANILAHQRLADRATVEKALEKMEVSSKLNLDMLAARCARLLQHLLQVEVHAAQGQDQSTHNVRRNESNHEDDVNALLITIPYFGNISISHEGIKRVETLVTSPSH